MINIENKAQCCGCNACGDICPKNAITYQTDNEGIWYPVVDKDKCVDCGLCEKVCPVIHSDELKKNTLKQSVCYAAEHKNMEVIFDSTSGGLFSALADIMYKKGGYVGGAIFNDDLTVSHYVSNNKKDLPKIRSSKYLQSNAEGFYKKIKELLVSGEKVLVCGAPCQMAAMRAYLGKEYDNLIIADFICLGMNSPKVWRKYLDSFEERYGSHVVYAKAKSKEFGWRNLTQKVVLADGREVFETREVSKFTKGYIGTHLYVRPSCYECQFKGFPRMADITLADYWGIENYNQDMEKNIGTSLVMVNSKKGVEYFEEVKKRINFINMPFESILNGNKALRYPITKPSTSREEFFSDLDKLPFGEVIDKYSMMQPMGLKARIKNIIRPWWNKARLVKRILYVTRCSPKALFQTVYYSGLRNLYNGKGIIVADNCVINISKTGKLEFEGLLIFGHSGHFPGSKLESRLLVTEGSTLTILGDTHLSYGADIEVLKGGHLIFHGKKDLHISGANIGCTIICGDKIEIGEDVEIGRNVTIRDNNGGHYINRQGYKNTRPVIIGKKAWLCESCTIMPGVRIGDSAIVGAKSFVIMPVPAHTMVSGHPAKVVDRDIQWKY